MVYGVCSVRNVYHIPRVSRAGASWATQTPLLWGIQGMYYVVYTNTLVVWFTKNVVYANTHVVCTQCLPYTFLLSTSCISLIFGSNNHVSICCVGMDGNGFKFSFYFLVSSFSSWRASLKYETNSRICVRQII